MKLQLCLIAACSVLVSSGVIVNAYFGKILRNGSTCEIEPTNSILGFQSRNEEEQFERAIHDGGCARLVVHGAVEIFGKGSGTQGLQFLKGLVEVYGYLTIEHTSCSSLAGLESLTDVASEFGIKYNDVLRNASLPNLHGAGKVVIGLNFMLDTVILSKLDSVKSIRIDFNIRLTRLNLSGMQQVTGNPQDTELQGNSWLCVTDPKSYQIGNPVFGSPSWVNKTQPCGCPAGSYVDGTRCASCPTGFYCAGATEGKTPCPSMMTSIPSSFGSSDCTCLPGTVRQVVVGQLGGATQCLNCGTGSIADPDANKCVCDAGFEPGAGNCIRCGSLKRKDGYGNTYCEVDVSLLIFVIIGVAVVVLVICLLSGWSLRKKRARLIQAALRKERKQEKIKAGIDAMSMLDFPMVVMKANIFLGLCRLIPHETAIAKTGLLWLSSVEDIKRFVSSQKIIFFSHQWLGFREPDPHNTHYDCMVQALGNIADRRGWSLLDIYVWVDYISIPQAVRYTQLGAIRSLPLYASLASAFVIVAPSASHADLDIECNLSTYEKRAWCRLECVSQYCCLGTDYMFFTTDNSIENVTENFLEDVLLVFDGQCTCCRLQHKGIAMCDKELLVTPVLALYAKVCMEKDRSDASRRVYNFIQQHKDLMFPKTFTAAFEPGMEEVRASQYGNFSYLKHVLHRDCFGEVDPHVAVRVEERELFGTILDDLPEVLEKMRPVMEARLMQPAGEFTTSPPSCETGTKTDGMQTAGEFTTSPPSCETCTKTDGKYSL